MITLANLKERIQQYLPKDAADDGAALQTKLQEFMQYTVDNYDLLDEAAKSHVNELFARLQKEALKAMVAVPDGPDKRRTIRQLSLAGGGHFQAENLLAILESPPQHVHPIIPAARQTFLEVLQLTLDVLFDVTRQPHTGGANLAKVGLSYWAIDELLAAVRLAQCAFTNQSYAHIRTDYEILDLIELFDQKPQWAQLWMSGDDKTVWSELRPAAVRKKLGTPKDDAMYSFLSEHGPHGTFRGLQARSLEMNPETQGGGKRFKVWVGGSPMVHHIVWTNSLCVYTSLQLLVKSVKIFGDYLDQHEAQKILEVSGKAVGQFFREHFLQWAKDEGLDSAPAIDFLENEPWKKR